MGRLTERNPGWLGEEFWTSAREPDDGEIDDVYERLKYYEDLEEAGRLVELPCKPGEWVYCIEDYYDEAEVSGYLFLATCGEYVIVCVEIYGLDESFDEQLEEMAEETQLGDDVGVKIFHMSKVFKTPEEAYGAIEEVE